MYSVIFVISGADVVVDASQEMMTLGLCNILGSFVQALPSCGAFTRSSVASSSDVRTPLQGVYSGKSCIGPAVAGRTVGTTHELSRRFGD